MRLRRSAIAWLVAPCSLGIYQSSPQRSQSVGGLREITAESSRLGSPIPAVADGLGGTLGRRAIRTVWLQKRFMQDASPWAEGLTVAKRRKFRRLSAVVATSQASHRLPRSGRGDPRHNRPWYGGYDCCGECSKASVAAPLRCQDK